MPKRPPSLFLSRHYPYYIVTSDYRQTSAGVRATHYLCHVLNEQGYEAYITAKKSSPFLRTPVLDDTVLERHRLAGRPGIAVYPEVISGNPLGQDVIVRWLLNKPGHLGGDEKPAPTDIVFHWDAWVLTPDIISHRLALPIIDTRIFNNDASPHNEARSGFCYYAHKYLAFGGKIDPWLSRNGISLCHDIPRPPEEIANILRRSTVLYSYEPSAIVLEAFACGCPVVYVATPYLEQFEWSAAEHAMMTVEDRLPDTPTPSYDATEYFKSWADRKHKETWKELSDFVRITQNAARQHSKRRASLAVTAAPEALAAGIPQSRNHLQWQSSRRIDASDGTILADVIASWRNPPEFHLIVRTGEVDRAALADTLDSLIYQMYDRWHIDIITELPCPDGLDALPSVGWQQTESDTAKPTIDFLVSTGQRDWIIELPPGAILDPLYLWRLADEIKRHPDIRAFFVDDSTLDENGICTQIRFKPGTNIEWLRSTDLAGPICVRSDVWQVADGVSQNNDSHWFSQLLGIAAKCGWDSIKHIPDVLISYSGTFPSDTQSCLLGLYNDLQQKGIQGDFLPATSQSWNIRYPLTTTPQISIAIISQNQLELLTRCFYSIVEKTSYPNFEILILLPSIQDDPDMKAWLGNIQQLEAPKVRVISGNSTDSYATLCNTAVRSTPNDFVALIQEDTVVIQAQWLEELVRTCLQENVAAASPRLISPGTSKIQNTGSVLGLGGLVGSPYQGLAKLGDPGYLDCLQVARDVSILPGACMLARTANYLAVGGMDENHLGNYYADADLCLKLRAQKHRLIYQPLATVVDGGSRALDIEGDFAPHLREELAKAQATEAFSKRWLTTVAVDPFWNPNLSLVHLEPKAETSFHPQWQYLPTDAPRIFARPITGAQATYRITSPLRALRKAGLASECIWPMGGQRELTAPELIRLAPDSVIVQQHLYDHHLEELNSWQTLSSRPFTVYSLDDLVTQMAGSNPFIKNIPSNSRTRLKYALERCDRLVVTTNTLAEMSHGFISDIRVVPNRLEQEIWLPLQSKKRTSKKPRIGWAGGSSHQGDLILLREVIEQTKDEADWVFFGMCPEEIRPLLKEFHGLQTLSEYPQKLASLNLDIAVAPLAQIPFNQAKSNLRLLEYGALGIPVVCTDIDPYRDSPACCVRNTPAAWIAAIRERIHDPDAREQEGVALRRWVHQNYLLENHLDEWLAAHLSTQPN